VQKPLAIVVVTGMMLAPLVILITLPVLISYFSRVRRSARSRTAVPGCRQNRLADRGIGAQTGS